MTDDLNQVATLAGEMTALRERLAQLNAERVTIEGQIAGYVDRIAAAAAAAGGIPLPAASPGAAPIVEWHDPMPLSAAVLYVMRRSPETAFSAVEIAAILQMTDDVGSIRTHLSRMAKDGRAMRVSFGKYKAR
jgi:hypothetical protein